MNKNPEYFSILSSKTNLPEKENFLVKKFGPKIRLFKLPFKSGLACFLAYLFILVTSIRENFPDGVWAVITVCVLTANQPNSGKILLISTLRIIGTVFGALVATFVAAVVYFPPPRGYFSSFKPYLTEVFVFSIPFMTTLFFQLYFRPQHSYGFVIFSVTFFMAFSGFQTDEKFMPDFHSAAVLRTFQVLCGCAISFILEFFFFPTNALDLSQTFLSTGFTHISQIFFDSNHILFSSSLKELPGVFILDSDFNFFSSEDSSLFFSNFITKHFALLKTPFAKAFDFYQDSILYEKVFHKWFFSKNHLKTNQIQQEKHFLLLKCGLRIERILASLFYDFEYFSMISASPSSQFPDLPSGCITDEGSTSEKPHIDLPDFHPLSLKNPTNDPLKMIFQSKSEFELIFKRFALIFRNIGYILDRDFIYTKQFMDQTSWEAFFPDSPVPDLLLSSFSSNFHESVCRKYLIFSSCQSILENLQEGISRIEREYQSFRLQSNLNKIIYSTDQISRFHILKSKLNLIYFYSKKSVVLADQIYFPSFSPSFSAASSSS